MSRDDQNSNSLHHRMHSRTSISSGEMDDNRSSYENFAPTGVDRYFNNVLSIVSAVAVLVLFYLNFRMFETYIGEFMFAFVFSEALWDTKKTFTTWFEKVNSLAINEDSRFSLRAELNSKIIQWASIFDPRQILQLQNDLSGAYMQAGVVITALVIRPSLCISAGLIFLVIVTLVAVLNNRLLFIFRLHVFVGVSHDTLVAFFLVGGLVCVSALLTLAFGILISRDINLLSVETSRYLESQVRSEGSFVNTVVQGSITAIKPLLENNSDYVENLLEDMPGVRELVYQALNVMQTTPMNEESDVLESEMCMAEFSSFSGLAEYIVCLRTELMSIPLTIFLPSVDYIPDLMLRSKNVLTIATTVPLVLMDIGFRLVFFITILFLLLSSRETALESFLRTFTVARSEEESLIMTFEEELQRSMEAILIIPTRMSLLNSMATIIVMFFFDLRGRYLCASAVFFFSMFPLVVPCCVIIPWLLFYIAAYDMSWASAWFIFLFHFACHYIVQNWALIGLSQVNNHSGNEADSSSVDSCSEKDVENYVSGGKREYVTTLTIFFGMVTFGAKGILIGPFLFCLIMISQKVYLNYKALSGNGTIDYRRSKSWSSNRRKSSVKGQEEHSKNMKWEEEKESLELDPDNFRRKSLKKVRSWYGGSEENITALAMGFAKMSNNSPTLRKTFFPRRKAESGKVKDVSAVTELSRVYSIYEKGGLSQEEYEAVKQRIILKILE